MTIEEKIINWIALASNLNQVTGVKLAEILTEMNDVIAVVNANNQALMATNQQLQADITALNSSYSSLVTQLNSHVGNTGIHLTANQKANLNFIGFSWNIAQVQLTNGVTQSKEDREVGQLGYNNAGKLEMIPATYKAYISGNPGNFRLEIYKMLGTPIFVTAQYGIKLYSYENDNYTYKYALPGVQTLDEAFEFTKTLRIVWIFYR
jgi:hypothetical protein